jgi:Flp pilus assembly protein CpaB
MSVLHRFRSTRRGVPRGRSRFARFGRGVWRSPLVRVLVALLIASRLRAAYVDLATQRDAWGASTRVAVATRTLNPGDTLRAEDLRWVRLPNAAIPPHTTDRVIGQRITTAVGVGEVIGPSRFTAVRVSRLRAKTGAGRVAVPVSIGDVTAVVVDGDEVDVLDASGAVVASAARVLQVADRQVTVSVKRDQLTLLAPALANPVVLALLGPESSTAPESSIVPES